MLDKIKSNSNKLVAGGAVIISSFLGSSAFAAETGVDVGSIITTTASGIMADSGKVITAGIGIGAVFFSAKLVWTKFKSMAR